MIKSQKIMMMPDMGLSYFKLLIGAVERYNKIVIQTSFFPMRGILFGEKIAVIHLHMLDQIFLNNQRLPDYGRIAWFFLVILPVVRLRRIRLVWTCHEWSAHENDRKNFTPWLNRIICRNADHVIVHNREMRERVLLECRSIGRNRVSIVPHGDLFPYYRRFIKKKQIQNPHNDNFIFASIGYMRRNKGTDIVIKAFCSLLGDKLSLRVIGNCLDPIYRAELIALSVHDARITLEFRDLSDDELTAQHLEADAIVFGFRECPTSGSVITAMSLGLPVIAPRIGHLLDLLHEDVGWSFDPHEKEIGLAAAMQAAAADRDQCRNKGRAAASQMAAESWELIGKRMVEIYEGHSNSEHVQ
jgi:beta-1,4-mannosyltransferase